MGTVLVDYYEAECVRCGWKHRVMYGAGLGSEIAHTLAVARHANATLGHCTAHPDEIREQPRSNPMTKPRERVELRVGQVWRDNDKRCNLERRLRVIDVRPNGALCEIIQGLRVGAWVSIVQHRFGQKSNGYSLVAQPEDANAVGQRDE